MSAREFTQEDLEVAVPERWSARQDGDRVAARYGLTFNEMIGPSRMRPCPRARAEFYRLLRQCGWSYPKIGMFCGGRDHATIMSAICEPVRLRKAIARKTSAARRSA